MSERAVGLLPKVILVCLAGVGGACKLPLAGASCPCASGWTCCEGQNICVTSLAECPAKPDASSPPAADGGTSARCLGVPAIIAASRQEVLPCETLTLTGANLDCPGTTVQVGPYSAMVIGPGCAPNQLLIRLPAVHEALEATLTATNAMGAGNSTVKLRFASGTAPAGTCVRTSACGGAPAFGPPGSQFRPSSGMSCRPVVLFGRNFGCVSSVTFGSKLGDIEALPTDAQLGPDALGVRVPAGVSGPVKITVTTPGGTVVSDDAFTVADVGCAPEEATPAVSNWQQEIVDHGGSGSSLAIDSAGAVHVSYLDGDRGAVKHAVRAASGGWWVETVEAGLKLASASTSLAGGPDGDLHLVYADDDGVVRVAAKPRAHGWEFASLDHVGRAPRVAIDPTQIHVVFFDAAQPQLLHAVRPLAGGSWQSEVIAPIGIASASASLAVAVDRGLLRVCFPFQTTASSSTMKCAAQQYMELVGLQWIVTDAETSDHSNLGGPSLGADSAGGLHLFFNDQTAHWVRYASSTDSRGWVPRWQLAGAHGPAVALDGADGVHVAYGDGAADWLYYVTGSSKTGQLGELAVASPGAGSASPSLVIDAAGVVRMTYRDPAAGELMVATRCQAPGDVVGVCPTPPAFVAAPLAAVAPTSGVPGQPITIKGHGLACSSLRVAVGPTDAEVVSSQRGDAQGYDEIVVKVPDLPPSVYAVSVNTTRGQVIWPGTFTVAP